MQDLEIFLKDKLAGSERIAILGIGSELRGDDAAGMLVAEAVSGLAGAQPSGARIKVFFGSSSPENITGEIKRFNPTHLLIIDSADMGEKPGAISLIAEDKIGPGSASTHRMSLKILIEYLRACLNCRVYVVGIQPAGLGLNRPVSEEVMRAVKRLSAMIKEAIAGI